MLFVWTHLLLSAAFILLLLPVQQSTLTRFNPLRTCRPPSELQGTNCKPTVQAATGLCSILTEPFLPYGSSQLQLPVGLIVVAVTNIITVQHGDLLPQCA